MILMGLTVVAPAQVKFELKRPENKNDSLVVPTLDLWL